MDAEEDDGHSFSGGGRDCAVVRAFFCQSVLPYVKINLDVFPRARHQIGRAHV